MSVLGGTRTGGSARPMLAEPVLVAILIATTAVAAVGTAIAGPAALLAPLIVACAIGVAAAPHNLLLVVLTAMIVLEPGAIDPSGNISPLLYALPAGVGFPLSTSPIEIVIVLAALFSVRHWDRLARLTLPRLAFAIPVFIALGFVYGAMNGGLMNIGYNEARGLIFGTFVFVVVASSDPAQLQRLGVWMMVATGALAAIITWRYFAFVKPGNLEIPIEFAFAHESSLLLGIGLVSALTMFARSKVRGWQRVAMLGYCVLICVALVVSQRRAATLVAMVGSLTVCGLFVRKRPVMVAVVAIPLTIVFAAYMGAYWNKEYGAAAQPARAIRSQIDPSPRDESSDLYRDNERTNVIQTLRENTWFGVGFGRQFAQYKPLPNLESFWPLQYYTPHQNLLWLWLKLGFFGVSAFLAVVAIAVGRCVRIVLRSEAVGDVEALAIITAATLLMFLAFATVDIALVGPRGTAPLAVALAIAFALPQEKRTMAAGGSS